MTKLFDDRAREEYLKSGDFKELEYNETPVRDMVVKEVKVKEVRKYIATYHYTNTMPDSTKYVYAGYYGEKLAGIVVYGMGAGKNQYTALIPTIQKGEYLELTRLWSSDPMPKNTESKLIAESLKLLPKNVKLVVSFADPSRKHIGYIYQATNWLYCGMSNGGKVLVTKEGLQQHPRLLGIYKMRHPELRKKTNKEIMEQYGWTYAKSSGKYRYCYIRGTKKEKQFLLGNLESKTLSYPKG